MVIDKNTKWEDLLPEQREFFNEFAAKHQEFLQRYKILMERGTCFMCKYKHKGWNDLSFHVSSTHGIPPEMFYDMLKNNKM